MFEGYHKICGDKIIGCRKPKNEGDVNIRIQTIKDTSWMSMKGLLENAEDHFQGFQSLSLVQKLADPCHAAAAVSLTFVRACNVCTDHNLWSCFWKEEWQSCTTLTDQVWSLSGRAMPIESK